MKKLLLIALGVFFSGAIVWAAINVNSIQTKATGDSVSFTEFNSVVGTVKGIFNAGNGSTHSIGINVESPSPLAALSVNRFIKVVPIAKRARPTCEIAIAGAIYAEKGNGNHLWGCNGTKWVQLDTGDSVRN